MLISAKELIKRFKAKCAGESFLVKFLFALTAFSYSVYLFNILTLKIPLAIKFMLATQFFGAIILGSTLFYVLKLRSLMSKIEPVEYWFGKKDDELHDKILKTKGRDSAYMN